MATRVSSQYSWTLLASRRARRCRRVARAQARSPRRDVDLLIIDDLGLRNLNGDEPLDLYELIRQRYEKASTIITSNRAIEEWAPLFNDKLLAGAAMDRLLHHAHVIEITGHSYRNPPTSGRGPRQGR